MTQRTGRVTFFQGGLTLLATLCVAASAAAQQSAYQGAMGDWALGLWKGSTYDKRASTTGTGARAVTVEMLVERQADGRVLCKLMDVRDRASAQWAPECSITADRVTMTTPNRNSVTVSRKGAGLEGDFDITTPQNMKLGLAFTR